MSGTNVPDLGERNFNMQTGYGGIALLGVDLIADTPELRFGWHRRVWMVAPPTPELVIVVPDEDEERSFVVDNVEVRVGTTTEESMVYGTYTAFGQLLP